MVFLRIISAYFLALWLLGGMVAQAKPAQKYASIIVDADTLEILHARKIDSSRYPASTTKMMTLYLVFDALDRGEIHLHDKMKVSRFAANTPPVKLGLRAGSTISVENAIKALTVRSANDVSVVIAEHLGGTQENFARMMTQKAKALGMRSTRFKNPHGLPDPEHITTARDMAKLAKAHFQNHARYYHFFGVKSFHYQGRTYTNHNRLLGRIEGVDGFKTGFTNASGYNLVISAKRGGHRIIAVVLGGATGRSRDQHMADLIDRGFEVIRQNALRATNTQALYADNQAPLIRKYETSPAPDYIKAFTLRAGYGAQNTPSRVTIGPASAASLPAANPLHHWSIQIGAFSSARAAQMANRALIAQPEYQLRDDQGTIHPVSLNGRFLYRARIGDLSFERARKICQALGAQERACQLISPAS
ncbi:MAG TPA: D-alanyl-D-alanine carboxypeptidase [Hellea balneolensis]|uniref:D-alanyl-D-alanine carboxypeptidase n=1 Tax=Hellea balneolensis TaxID=287478 RepID=A0A7C5LT17_9PROT|nr:D-alanyl-D-alanine carboxypeptidase [Hellea balneolensis]